jgi:hypothetical protein
VTYAGGGGGEINSEYEFIEIMTLQKLEKKNVPRLLQSFPDGVLRNVRGSARKFHYNIMNDYLNTINLITWTIILENDSFVQTFVNCCNL